MLGLLGPRGRAWWMVYGAGQTCPGQSSPEPAGGPCPAWPGTLMRAGKPIRAPPGAPPAPDDVLLAASDDDVLFPAPCGAVAACCDACAGGEEGEPPALLPHEVPAGGEDGDALLPQELPELLPQELLELLPQELPGLLPQELPELSAQTGHALVWVALQFSMHVVRHWRQWQGAAQGAAKQWTSGISLAAYATELLVQPGGRMTRLWQSPSQKEAKSCRLNAYGQPLQSCTAPRSAAHTLVCKARHGVTL